MQNHYSSLEEISSFESFVITSHISSYHHKMMYGLPKNFKKIVKNDSKEAFKINAKVYHSTVTGKSLTQKSSELFDDIVDHPEKLKAESQFIKQLKSLICAELAGDFHLGYARQLTDKSSLLFDLAF